MRFEERLQVPVSVDEAWAFLWETERLAACLPGCTEAVAVSPGERYTARFEDRIGPYRAQFDLDIQVQEVRPREFIRIFASGQDKRLGASQRLTLDVSLQPVNTQETALDITADVEILGKVATLGQFAVKRKARDVVQQFARNVRAALRPSGVRDDHA
jgi:uncharacterized protein